MKLVTENSAPNGYGLILLGFIFNDELIDEHFDSLAICVDTQVRQSWCDLICIL